MLRIAALAVLLLTACRGAESAVASREREAAADAVADSRREWDPVHGVGSAVGLERAGESFDTWRNLMSQLDPSERKGRTLDESSVDCLSKEIVLWVDTSSGRWRAFGPARILTCEVATAEDFAPILEALDRIVAEDPERAAFSCWVGRTKPETELTRRSAKAERDRVLQNLRREFPALVFGDFDCDFATAERSSAAASADWRSRNDDLARRSFS